MSKLAEWKGDDLMVGEFPSARSGDGFYTTSDNRKFILVENHPDYKDFEWDNGKILVELPDTSKYDFVDPMHRVPAKPTDWEAINYFELQKAEAPKFDYVILMGMMLKGKARGPRDTSLLYPIPFDDRDAEHAALYYYWDAAPFSKVLQDVRWACRECKRIEDNPTDNSKITSWEVFAWDVPGRKVVAADTALPGVVRIYQSIQLTQELLYKWGAISNECLRSAKLID